MRKIRASAWSSELHAEDGFQGRADREPPWGKKHEWVNGCKDSTRDLQTLTLSLAKPKMKNAKASHHFVTESL